MERSKSNKKLNADTVKPEKEEKAKEKERSNKREKSHRAAKSSDGVDKKVKKPQEKGAETAASVYPQGAEQEKILEAFVDHAWNNQLAELKALLPQIEQHKLINALNCRGQSALYCASRNGHNRIIIELLNRPGIDVNVIATPHGGTPLHAAASNGRKDAIALLLVAGANRKIKTVNGVDAKTDAKPEMLPIFEQFEKESVIECLRDFVVLRELNVVQEELRKESEKRIAQKKVAIEQKEKQKAEDEEAAAAFQSKFGRKKEEKVKINYSALSDRELEDHIAGLALSKPSFSFMADQTDTNFLNYFNNPALSAQLGLGVLSIQSNVSAASDASNVESESNSANALSDRMNQKLNKLMFEAPEVEEVRSKTYSTYEQGGVLEALGFNPLFFNGSVYKVEEDTDETNGLTGKTARSARQDPSISLKSSRVK